MTKKFLTEQLALLVTVAGAATLSFESYLSLQNKSLCKTEACAVVSKYLTINESLLVSAGALYFWILALVLFFATRYPKLKYVPFFLLAPALAFDSSLIGFQIFIIQQECILCISVAALLILITILFCLSRKSFVLLTCFSLVWLGAFGVNKFITMPSPQGAYYNMAFFSTKNKSGSSENFNPKMTLIISMNCPHCLDVIHFLSKNYPPNVNFRLASIDSDHASLSRLSLFLHQAPKTPNPFNLLKNIKEKTSIADIPVNRKLTTQTQNGMNYLSNLGINSIPVLVSELKDKEKRIIIGSDEIISFLENTIDPQH